MMAEPSSLIEYILPDIDWSVITDRFWNLPSEVANLFLPDVRGSDLFPLDVLETVAQDPPEPDDAASAPKRPRIEPSEAEIIQEGPPTGGRSLVTVTARSSAIRSSQLWNASPRISGSPHSTSSSLSFHSPLLLPQREFSEEESTLRSLRSLASRGSSQSLQPIQESQLSEAAGIQISPQGATTSLDRSVSSESLQPQQASDVSSALSPSTASSSIFTVTDSPSLPTERTSAAPIPSVPLASPSSFTVTDSPSLPTEATSAAPIPSTPVASTSAGSPSPLPEGDVEKFPEFPAGIDEWEDKVPYLVLCNEHNSVGNLMVLVVLKQDESLTYAWMDRRYLSGYGAGHKVIYPYDKSGVELYRKHVQHMNLFESYLRTPNLNRRLDNIFETEKWAQSASTAQDTSRGWSQDRWLQAFKMYKQMDYTAFIAKMAVDHKFDGSEPYTKEVYGQMLKYYMYFLNTFGYDLIIPE